MKKTPTPQVAAPAQLDFVLARVFDMYRELASRERTASGPPRNCARSESRKPREKVQ